MKNSTNPGWVDFSTHDDVKLFVSLAGPRLIEHTDKMPGKAEFRVTFQYQFGAARELVQIANEIGHNGYQIGDFVCQE